MLHRFQDESDISRFEQRLDALATHEIQIAICASVKKEDGIPGKVTPFDMLIDLPVIKSLPLLEFLMSRS